MGVLNGGVLVTLTHTHACCVQLPGRRAEVEMKKLTSLRHVPYKNVVREITRGEPTMPITRTAVDVVTADKRIHIHKYTHKRVHTPSRDNRKVEILLI